MPKLLDKAIKALRCSRIVVIRLDIVKTFSSSLIIFLMMFSLAKDFGMIQLLTHISLS
jgi:hypothetical protein